jgi:hypothetical protein
VREEKEKEKACHKPLKDTIMSYVIQENFQKLTIYIHGIILVIFDVKKY